MDGIEETDVKAKLLLTDRDTKEGEDSATNAGEQQA